MNTGLSAAEKPPVWARPPSLSTGPQLEKRQAHVEAGPSCIHEPGDPGLTVPGAQEKATCMKGRSRAPHYRHLQSCPEGTRGLSRKRTG